MCLVCGRDNPFGLHARFYELAPEEPAAAGAPAAGPELLGVFDVREEHQSYPGRLHGGISSTILDETIGRAILLLQPGAWGVTVEFNVRFRKPVPLDEEVRCVARITRDTSRLFEGTGEILLADGTRRRRGLGQVPQAVARGHHRPRLRRARVVRRLARDAGAGRPLRRRRRASGAAASRNDEGGRSSPDRPPSCTHHTPAEMAGTRLHFTLKLFTTFLAV